MRSMIWSAVLVHLKGRALAFQILIQPSSAATEPDFLGLKAPHVVSWQLRTGTLASRQQVSADYLTRIAGCRYRNLAGPGPGRQNGWVSSAAFFEDRWRRYPHLSLSGGPAGRRRGFGSSRS